MSALDEEGWAHAEALAIDAAEGSAAAARDLVAAMWPHWLRLAARSRTSAAGDDAAREVATRLAEKLGRPRSPELRSYEGWKRANPHRAFADWMRIVVANASRDVHRAENGRASDDGTPSRKRLLNEIAARVDADAVGTRPPVTAAQTARELLEFAADALDDAQRRVLAAWLEGSSFDEIAHDLPLPDGEAARRMLRSGIAVLRRRFARSHESA